jgi:hypothetical protein
MVLEYRSTIFNDSAARQMISNTDAKEIVRDVYQATNFGKIHLHHMTLGDQQTGDNQRLRLGVLQQQHLSIYYVRPNRRSKTVCDTRVAIHVSRRLIHKIIAFKLRQSEQSAKADKNCRSCAYSNCKRVHAHPSPLERGKEKESTC